MIEFNKDTGGTKKVTKIPISKIEELNQINSQLKEHDDNIVKPLQDKKRNLNLSLEEEKQLKQALKKSVELCKRIHDLEEELNQ